MIRGLSSQFCRQGKYFRVSTVSTRQRHSLLFPVQNLKNKGVLNGQSTFGILMNGNALSQLRHFRGTGAVNCGGEPAPVIAQSVKNEKDSVRNTSSAHLKKSQKMIRPKGVISNMDFRKLTRGDIETKCGNLIRKSQELYDSVASTDKMTFETIVKPLLTAAWFGWTHLQEFSFPSYVAESAEVRSAADAATKVFEEFSLEMNMRPEIFEKLTQYKEKYADSENLTSEQRRSLDFLIRDGKRNGLHLSEEIRNKLMEIKKKLCELTLRFSQNLIEDTTKVLFSAEELAGLPTDFIETLKKDKETDKYILTLKYPHLIPVGRYCHIPETRKRIETAYLSRCLVENSRILEEVVELRHQEAQLLGFSSHSEFVQEVLMAKNPETVANFLEDLGKQLQPVWEAEREELVGLKKLECEKYGYEFNGKLDPWDFRYYLSRVEEQKFAVDQNKLKPYFPLDAVTNGMMSIYEELLSLKFTPVPDAEKWHDEVNVFQVTDSDFNELLGYIYIDLFPREGKYGHACCAPVQPGCLDADGVKQPSISIMLCNFTRPTSTNPSLLDHKEVETYFHEFGHLMHTMCSRAETALFFGTRVETDFVEVPSQMLENWVWEKEALRRMSSHYETKKPLPDELIEKLQASRRASIGTMKLKQTAVSIFDQKLHSGIQCGSKELYAQVLHDLMGIETIPDTNFAAQFGHMCGGYNASYYSYLWSEVFSMDIFESVFKKNGIFNKEYGRRYREFILQPGGSKDGADMLRTFLGREPNNEAFLKSFGLN